jgi:hypothetical protein
MGEQLRPSKGPVGCADSRLRARSQGPVPWQPILRRHTTVNTWWNAGHPDPIVTPPFDTDGKPASFHLTEQRDIIAIWRAVAEDFAPFDVDVSGRAWGLARRPSWARPEEHPAPALQQRLAPGSWPAARPRSTAVREPCLAAPQVTTEDPGDDKMWKSSADDLAYGQRLCIGGSSMDWCAAEGQLCCSNAGSLIAQRWPLARRHQGQRHVAGARSRRLCAETGS